MAIKQSSSEKSMKAWTLVSSLQEYFKAKLCDVFGEGCSFHLVHWLRDGGDHGGGQRQESTVKPFFDRASINISQVQYEDDDSKRLRAATALSTIIHPQHPLLPSIHMHISWTEMKSGEGYWRIMADLNPSIPSEEDRELFINDIKIASGSHFELGCKQGDHYFFIPALERHRGVAHFYLEHFNSSDFEKDYAFAEQFGLKMMDGYGRILTNHLSKQNQPSKDHQSEQLDYHTLYFLQVLTLDRGTTSGLLVHDQNDVGTLGSIPSHVNKDKLKEWVSKLSYPQNELLEKLIAVLAPSNPSPVTEDVKKALAQEIRSFYKTYPEALELQAKGFVRTDSVDNHQK